MPKTATIAVRIDEDLKARAQKALEDMGLPMSLAVEMFLRQVADTGRLPFSVGPEGPSPEETTERERRERDFWHEFMVWYFRAWPRFDSLEAERQAREELDWDGRAAGETARDYIGSEKSSDSSRMTPEQWAAWTDISAMQVLLLDAKELVYWALGMDKTFIPSMSGSYNGMADSWRLQYLRDRLRNSFNDGEVDEMG